ncbi:MAG: hypothetical protein IJ642_03395 [Oscillospiraceae bacterium]|nr:hypothetical protein [Oscillospiraceae bacterium]
MNIFMQTLRKQTQAQSVQNLFMRISLKDYFETLAEMTENQDYMQTYQKILPYTCLSSDFIYDFMAVEEEAPYQAVTIGEMLAAAMEMFIKKKYIFFKENSEYEELVEKTGCMLVEELFMKPLLQIYHQQKGTIDTCTQT